MFFSYTSSVFLLSLAMYGIWCFLKDMWDWLLEPHLLFIPSVSFLIVVKNLEGEIEELMRYTMREIEESTISCDVVVVDSCSDDQTPAMLSRLAEEFAVLRVVNVLANARPVTEALPLCRGSVVHVLDLGTRITGEEFMVTVCALLRRDRREVVVRAS